MVFYCSIVSDTINSNSILTSLKNPVHGAHTSFFGVVRAQNMGREVISIEYDVFVPLAEKCFRDFCSEAQTRWDDELEIILTHRIGTLSVGDISVAIAVASRHRDESYQASRYIIEELKKRAPIWKKEFYIDGESDWVQGHALCTKDRT